MIRLVLTFIELSLVILVTLHLSLTIIDYELDLGGKQMFLWEKFWISEECIMKKEQEEQSSLLC